MTELEFPLPQIAKELASCSEPENKVFQFKNMSIKLVVIA